MISWLLLVKTYNVHQDSFLRKGDIHSNNMSQTWCAVKTAIKVALPRRGGLRFVTTAGPLNLWTMVQSSEVKLLSCAPGPSGTKKKNIPKAIYHKKTKTAAQIMREKQWNMKMYQKIKRYVPQWWWTLKIPKLQIFITITVICYDLQRIPIPAIELGLNGNT